MVPKDGSINRERILVAAERLVIDDGYAATSLDDVIREAGTSKGAFFHHFESKLDLARSLVERYATADIAHLDGALAQLDGLAPGTRLVAFLRIFEDTADELMSAQSSCLYAALLAERQLVQEATREPIRRAALAWRTQLSAIIGDALPEGDVDGIDIDPDALADHVFVTFEGAFILCRTMQDPGHMKAQLRVLRQLVERLVSQD